MERDRTSRSLAASAGILLLAAALFGASPPKPREVVLGPGETQVAGPLGLTLCFDAVIEDSRCPENALCIRAGNARASFVATVPNTPPVPFSLNTDEGPKSAVAFGSEFTLVRLEPRPRVGVPRNPRAYRVTVRVQGGR